ncbi:MAG: anthranilate synthase component II [Planctomycetota bacterium]|jgi:anthranilate synthase/aminodeoxychorismate synthase-like glutamine amidotransferase
MKRVLLIDNYDSFVYNLAQYMGELGASILVRRNDAIGLEEAEALKPTHLVVSPGPGRPSQTGVCKLFINHFAKKKVPVLGVCLGHQAIAEVFGGEVVLADRMMHGKMSPIYHDSKSIFRDLPNPFDATRYHSLIAAEGKLPKDLEISAHTSEGEIMGLRHKSLPVEGVQFHPESITTKPGKDLLANFLK